MIFEIAFPLSGTWYVYVTRHLCVSYVRATMYSVVVSRWAPGIWRCPPHFDASKSMSTTSIELHHFRFNIRTRDWPWHISSTSSRISLADTARWPRDFRAWLKWPNVARHVRPSPGGFLLLSRYFFFLHSVASLIGCESAVILPGVAPTMTILCITWIENKILFMFAIDRQILKASITQPIKI